MNASARIFHALGARRSLRAGSVAPSPRSDRCSPQANDRGRDGFERGRQPAAIKRILVPTDFSPGSTDAVEHALALARQTAASLTFLHVIDISAQPAPGYSGEALSLMERLRSEGCARLGLLAWSLARNQIEARTMIVEGLPWEQIVKLSQDFDLVVLANGGAGSPRKFFWKHTARRVIENAACPVLVVNRRKSGHRPGHR